MSSQFSSEGFDLDAVAPDSGDGEVVFELGGGVSCDNTGNEISPNSIDKSEKRKAKGNEYFKNGAFLDAIDMYTDAINSCPGMSGKEILQKKEEFEEKERAKLLERNRKESEARRKRQIAQDRGEEEKEVSGPSTVESETEQVEKFKVPFHEFGEQLSVYHCNRAAAEIQLKRYDESIWDCTVAILLNPSYVKAYVRRSMAYEKTLKTDVALNDSKVALELDKNNTAIRKTVERLQKMEDERLEKLKEETIGKLKDLGNSILGNFGLSIDNFALQQQENGSYSVSFNK